MTHSTKNPHLVHQPWRARAVWRHLWPLGFYLGLTLVITLPLPLQLATYIPGLEGDAYVHLWTFDWLDRAIHSQRFSFHTTDLFYPNGVSMLNQNIAWFNAVVWVLLKSVLGAVPAYSLSVLLIPLFNGYALFLLARDVIAEVAESGADVDLAALLAGVVGTAWPAITSQLNHPNLVLVGFLALALRNLQRLIRYGHKRDVWWTGVFLGMLGLVRVQVLMLSVFLIAPVALCEIAVRGQLGNAVRWKQCLFSALIALPLVAFVVVPLAAHYLTEGSLSDLTVEDVAGVSQDLVFYALPNSRHPLWGTFVQRLVSESLDIAPPFYAATLGYSVAGLSGLALIYDRGRSQDERPSTWRSLRWGWRIAVILLFLLALGPIPRAAGHALRLKPYMWLYERFLLPIVREPRRFLVLLSIPLGVLAGVGIYRLCHQLPGRHRPILAWGAIVVICVEFTVYPCPGQPVATPAWFEHLAQEPGRFGVLDVPMYRQQDESYMLYQLTHRKPLVHGHVSRPPKEAFAFIDSVPLLAHMQHEVSSLPPAPPVNITRQIALLDEANIRYVILHRLFLTSAQLSAWRTWFVVSPYYEDASLVVYRTSPSVWMDAFDDAPSLFPGLRIAHGTTSSEETVPGGWVSVQIHWFITEEALGAPNVVCLMWRGADGRDLPANCDYPFYDGDGERIATQGLVENSYLVHVPFAIEGGPYTLVVSRSGGGTSAADPSLVVSTGITLNITPLQRGMAPPSPDQPIYVVFGDQIAMVGYDFTMETPERASLDLYWHALQQPCASYKVFVHVVDVQNGHVMLQQDFVPLNWLYPTNEWKSGEYIQDHVFLDLASLPPGNYQLRVGLYDPETGVRLLTTPAYPDDAVSLPMQDTASGVGTE